MEVALPRISEICNEKQERNTLASFELISYAKQVYRATIPKVHYSEGLLFRRAAIGVSVRVTVRG